MARITLEIPDDQMDALAELIVAKLLDHAPGLIDIPEEGSENVLGQAAGSKPAASKPKTATKAAASKSATKPKPAGTPTTTTTDPSLAADETAPKDIGQVAGYAGAIIDPRTRMAVMPGENVDGPDAPALPALPPHGAPE